MLVEMAWRRETANRAEPVLEEEAEQPAFSIRASANSRGGEVFMAKRPPVEMEDNRVRALLFSTDRVERLVTMMLGRMPAAIRP
jgi:hypothetical protein